MPLHPIFFEERMIVNSLFWDHFLLRLYQKIKICNLPFTMLLTYKPPTTHVKTLFMQERMQMFDEKKMNGGELSKRIWVPHLGCCKKV